MSLRIATRRSELALVQARFVAGLLSRALGDEATLVPLETTGDRLAEARLADVGGKGLFIKEIEQALLDGRADVAVHSAKDLPAELAPGLVLAAFPARADCRDALVVREGGEARSLEALPPGARVGTGSVRRTALLRALRPDLEVVPLRGNVPTRLRKLAEQDLDAVILACAGLDRLGLADCVTARIPPETMLPAPTQGILALETRAGDGLTERVASLSEPDAVLAASAERGLLARLGGDCDVPLGALAEPDAGGARLRALVASPDGRRVLRADVRASAPEAAAAEAAELLRAQGADALLAGAKGAP